MASHHAPIPAAEEARRRLAAALEEADPTGAVPARFGESEAVPIPAQAAQLLLDILDRMARGRTVTLGDDEEAASARRAALDGMTAIDQELGLQ